MPTNVSWHLATTCARPWAHSAGAGGSAARNRGGACNKSPADLPQRKRPADCGDAGLDPLQMARHTGKRWTLTWRRLRTIGEELRRFTGRPPLDRKARCGRRWRANGKVLQIIITQGPRRYASPNQGADWRLAQQPGLYGPQPRRAYRGGCRAFCSIPWGAFPALGIERDLPRALAWVCLSPMKLWRLIRGLRSRVNHGWYCSRAVPLKA